jgi:hypothetical protein
MTSCLRKKIPFAFSAILFICCMTAVSINAFAFPNKIMIVRHGDKLMQTDPGPTLSPKGQSRAMALALYYLPKFGEPDFIFAADPVQAIGKNSSIRELQTIAPLANLMAAKHPDTGFPIMHPYGSSDYKKLANDFLHNKLYDGKNIIVCWNHTSIPQLANALGVKTALPKWSSTDYDTVYVLTFNSDGLKQFSELHNQYPVSFDGSWQQINDGITK